MPTGKKLTKEQKDQILELSDGGFLAKDIAVTVGLGNSTVCRVIQNKEASNKLTMSVSVNGADYQLVCDTAIRHHVTKCEALRMLLHPATKKRFWFI